MTRTRYLSVNRIAFFIAGFLLLSTSLAVSANDNPKCEPNPVFKRFAGEVMGSCERARFKALELWGRKEIVRDGGPRELFLFFPEFHVLLLFPFPELL